MRPVGGGELRRLGAAGEHAQEVALGALGAAGADERARQRQLGGGVVGRVLELGVALRLDDLVEADAGHLGVAGHEVVLGRGQLLAQPVQRGRRLVVAQHARLLEVGQIARHGVARFAPSARRPASRRASVQRLDEEGDEQRDHSFVFSSSSTSGSYSGRSPSSSAVRATMVVFASGTSHDERMLGLVAEVGVLLLPLLPRPHLHLHRQRVRARLDGPLGDLDQLVDERLFPRVPDGLPSRRISARWRMKSGAPFQRSVAPSFEA